MAELCRDTPETPPTRDHPSHLTCCRSHSESALPAEEPANQVASQSFLPASCETSGPSAKPGQIRSYFPWDLPFPWLVASPGWYTPQLLHRSHRIMACLAVHPQISLL